MAKLYVFEGTEKDPTRSYVSGPHSSKGQANRSRRAAEAESPGSRFAVVAREAPPFEVPRPEREDLDHFYELHPDQRPPDPEPEPDPPAPKRTTRKAPPKAKAPAPKPKAPAKAQAPKPKPKAKAKA